MRAPTGAYDPSPEPARLGGHACQDGTPPALACRPRPGSATRAVGQRCQEPTPGRRNGDVGEPANTHGDDGRARERARTVRPRRTPRVREPFAAGKPCPQDVPHRSRHGRVADGSPAEDERVTGEAGLASDDRAAQTADGDRGGGRAAARGSPRPRSSRGTNARAAPLGGLAWTSSTSPSSGTLRNTVARGLRTTAAWTATSVITLRAMPGKPAHALSAAARHYGR